MSSHDVLASESRVLGVLIGTIVPTICSTIFVLARLYTRSIITKSWGWDDTLITVSWLASLCLAVLDCLFVKFGSGRHSFLQTLPDVIATLKLAFISRIIYQFVICITKLGICTFYMRVFQDKQSKRVIYSLLGFIAITALIIELAFLFSCKPVSGAWAIPPTCASPLASFYANTITGVIADVALMVFVIPRVLPLQLPLKQKIILLSVVSLGLLIIVAACIRLDRIIMLDESNDKTWDVSDLTTWTSIEVSVGLFCASAPAIRPLIRKIAPNLFPSVSQTLSRGGTLRQSGTKHALSKRNGYVHGTTMSRSRRGVGRDEAFELDSWDEGEFGKGRMGEVGNTFWVRTDSDEEERRNKKRTVDGKIMKTVRVSVHEDASRGVDDERERSRTESIMVKLDV
ncbi:hypothetical protein F5882DRAFT_162477 [Hyaloscypha sp. PMI_1271]|nr:hypothetical protein F5882DRAFT_162477 [Hyaloscypha sp. PMI_1271]